MQYPKLLICFTGSRIIKHCELLFHRIAVTLRQKQKAQQSFKHYKWLLMCCVCVCVRARARAYGKRFVYQTLLQSYQAAPTPVTHVAVLSKREAINNTGN
jgi:hypothetical protein